MRARGAIIHSMLFISDTKRSAERGIGNLKRATFLDGDIERCVKNRYATRFDRAPVSDCGSWISAFTCLGSVDERGSHVILPGNAETVLITGRIIAKHS
jgi:S-adenosylmethionine:diacylglycerol 3-amino-3-carboxypropyl transferase